MTETGPGGGLLGGCLCHDLLVVAAVERDHEPDGRDRGARGEKRQEDRQTVADVGLLGARLELLDALVVELADRAGLRESASFVSPCCPY